LDFDETMRMVRHPEASEEQKRKLAEGLGKAKLILSKIPDQEIARAARERRDQG
jgi:hypothetical protein